MSLSIFCKVRVALLSEAKNRIVFDNAIKISNKVKSNYYD